MTTLTTHDTKRGEDVRARIGVLSQVPSLWTEFVARWEIDAPSPDPATGQFLWQNIFGVWPVSGEVTDELRDRLHAYTEKAIREAAWHTSWNDPDTAFEDAVHRWLDTVLDGPVAAAADRTCRPTQSACRKRRAGPEAARADRARDTRRLPGHRAVGRQPGRPGQPPAGGLRRPTSRPEELAASEDSGRHRGASAAALPSGQLPARRLPSGARRRRRRPITWWRFAAATTSWSR